MLVKHSRMSQTTLHAPPAGTEDGAIAAPLVPAAVPAHATSELVVEERAPVGGASDGRSDCDTVRRLSAARAQRTDILRLPDERNSVRQKSYDLAQNLGGRTENAPIVAAHDRHVADLEARISALTTRFNLAIREIRPAEALPKTR